MVEFGGSTSSEVDHAEPIARAGPLWGVLAGLAFGAASAGMMLPMEFPDKPAVLRGSF